ncbi:outer membrane lipoprotein chaperone LolA [Ideonella livida]|uniref:Outer-membrane lipoprotein carrier protein n=1 Tax=Ideonella livida TaxID=2707176 RepID=A0A7C9PFE7_9BURK|nr:outer membrane lipoprotein chaperone LolA [Ideonella livida]NDY89674.1 outer membrane lipoprotein chaperone LolA [Ideonella livida]
MAAWADAADALRVFVKEVKAGQSSFTQTVYAPNGTKPKVSSGRFEFQRPNRFRFSYVKPYVQLIVGDGVKVWFHDPDLNQVTVRRLAEALGSTPAALLASGASLDDDFELKALPDQGGLQWVQATPRQQGGTVLWLKVGFRPGARVPATFEMGDSFGQRSVLSLPDLREESSLPAATFRFTPPAGADISEQ